MAYTDWGSPENPRVLLCVHGLTRNGRDFDFLAAALEDRYRVVCPDVAGRGRSDWLSRSEDYNNRQYVADMVTLNARLGIAEMDWLGTSMGGLMGMLMASMPGTPVRRLVLNDVGPWIPKAALERIGDYVGQDPQFDGLAGVEAYHRQVHASFGQLTDTQWRHLAKHNIRLREDGTHGLAYDPAIGDAFRSGTLENVDMWALWDAVRCPVLVLRGADSDLLPKDVAEEMTRRGPKADLVQFADCGHAPALMAPDQIDAVRRWLVS
jgi:pimeloyl-ACP methyl ester carboxylesterase